MTEHCWSHMIDFIERMQQERNAIECEAVKILGRDTFWISDQFVFRQDSESMRLMNINSNNCSNHYLTMTKSTLNISSRAVSMLIIMQSVKLISLPSEYLPFFQHHEAYPNDVCDEMQRDSSKMPNDIFQQSIAKYPELEELHMKKVFLVDEKGLGDSGYANRVRRYNADARKLFENVPWSEITKIKTKFDSQTCRVAIEPIARLRRNLTERQAAHKLE